MTQTFGPGHTLHFQPEHAQNSLHPSHVARLKVETVSTWLQTGKETVQGHSLGVSPIDPLIRGFLLRSCGLRRRRRKGVERTNSGRVLRQSRILLALGPILKFEMPTDQQKTSDTTERHNNTTAGPIPERELLPLSHRTQSLEPCWEVKKAIWEVKKMQLGRSKNATCEVKKCNLHFCPL